MTDKIKPGVDKLITAGMKHYEYEMLMVLPVPFRIVNNELCVEMQALHGLHRWLDHFDSLVLAAPVIPEELIQNSARHVWIPIDEEIKDKVYLAPLPWAFRPDKFIRCLPDTLRLLESLIDQSRYLQFAPWSFWGDWASVSAKLAMKKERSYAVHIDRVEHKVLLLTLAKQRNLYRIIQARVNAFLTEKWHLHVISRATVGLFHGMDTYEYYSQSLKDLNIVNYAAHNIHNIHDLNIDEGIKPHQKTDLLQILYTGQLIQEKAPLDWLKVFNDLKPKTNQLKATWIGDGPLRSEVLDYIAKHELTSTVKLPGFISNRQEVARFYQAADIFVFTHITPESPRCLLEALRFGVPILGYDSAFARELISENAGGMLVPKGDWRALSDLILRMVQQPELLDSLKQKALKDGERFTSKAVFTERANLIKKYLP